jgi:hypothetical protein
MLRFYLGVTTGAGEFADVLHVVRRVTRIAPIVCGHLLREHDTVLVTGATQDRLFYLVTRVAAPAALVSCFEQGSSGHLFRGDAVSIAATRPSPRHVASDTTGSGHFDRRVPGVATEALVRAFEHIRGMATLRIEMTGLTAGGAREALPMGGVTV